MTRGVIQGTGKDERAEQVYMKLHLNYCNFDFEDLSNGFAIGLAVLALTAFFTSYFMDENAHTSAITMVGYM